MHFLCVTLCPGGWWGAVDWPVWKKDDRDYVLADFMKERPTTVRCRQYMTSREVAVKSMEEQGVKVEQAPYLDYAYYISGYDYLPSLESFFLGRIRPQDVSSMLVGRICCTEGRKLLYGPCARRPEGRAFIWRISLREPGTRWRPGISQSIKWI